MRTTTAAGVVAALFLGCGPVASDAGTERSRSEEEPAAATAPVEPEDPGTDEARTAPQPWAEILEQHVTEGTKNGVELTLVDYESLADGDRHLEAYLEELATADLEALGPDARKALWINAYNALAIELIAENWPVESIRDLGGLLFNKVWDREVGTVGGRTVTLGEIEHEILREVGDPRIHMAIVCASISCPDLRSEPYMAEELDEQLDAQSRAFLSNPDKGMRLERDGATLTLSKIFDWFAEDFGGREGVIDFVVRHAPDEEAEWIDEHRDRLDLEYFEYDWAVNDAG